MASNQSFDTQNSSCLKVQILIVDDDSTSLSVVSAMLKLCSFRDDRNLELVVVTVKSPFDALSTLRLRKGVFDLVVTDLHMPEMNGMELQKQVDEEFKLPVIIMSSDDSENVILRSLEGGAAFYIVKPINKDDLNSVWQYAVATKTGNPPSIKEIGGTQEPSSSTLVEKIPSEDVNSATSMNGENSSKKDGKKKNTKRTKEDQEVNSRPASKKAKVVWTNSLHNRFLQAINHIGLDKAVPKRILEFMSVPGLSRENVASHLQKYRIFLKKVAERGARSSKNLSVRALRSTFASSQPSLMFKNFQQEYSNFPRQLQLSRGFGAFGGANFGNIQSPIQQAPSNNSALQPPYGQSPPFGNPTGFQQLIFGNANSGGQANQVRSGQESNGNIGANQASGGSVLNGLTSGTGPMQMYPPQSQARLNLQNFGSPTHKKFGSAGIQASKYRSGVGNIGHFNNSLNASNNYAGIRVTADGQLIGAGQMQLRKNEASNGFGNGANSGLMNWTHNGNMNVASVGGNIAPSSSYAAQRGSFPAGFECANQFPPTSFNNVYQGNAPMLPLPPPPPPPPQQQLGLGNGGQNHYAYGLTNNSPSVFGGNSNQQQQFGQGELNVSDMLLEPTNNLPAYQPQGVDQAGTSLHELLNPDFFNSLQIDENAPWNEQSSGKAQSGEGAMNPIFESNANSLEGHFPICDQQKGSGDLMDCELNSVCPVDNGPKENQAWDDDFLESLFGNEPLPRE